MDEMSVEIADILEVESVADSDELKSFAKWDSLAVLSLLAFLDKQYNVQLYNSDLENVKTVADVKQLVHSKM